MLKNINWWNDYYLDVDPRYNEITKLSDLSNFTLEEIKNFFQNYKTLQNIEVKVYEYHDLDEALDLIEQCKNKYKESGRNE